MAEKSIFSFLEKDKRFHAAYLNCIAMEKQILIDLYPQAITAGRSVSETLINIFVKNDYDLNKKFFIDYIDYKDNNLYNKILCCAKKDLIDEELADIYHKLRKDGNKSVHNTDAVFKFSNALKCHERIFKICLDCYNKFNEENKENIDYNFDLNYLNEDSTFTHEELINFINSINDDTIRIKDLINYINELEIFIPIDSFDNFIKDYKQHIIDLKEFNDTIDSIKYIDEALLERIIDNVNEEFSEELLTKIIKFNEENLNNVIDDLDNLEEDYIYPNAKEEGAYNPFINLLCEEYIKKQYNLIVKGLNDIKVSKVDKNNRYIVESPFLKVVEDNGKILIEEDKEKITLNKDQEAAVKYDGDKPLVIDAGPGSGKTRVIIERVVNLIREQNQPPSSILVITFTIKATEELRERFKNDTDLTINEINQMRISTIHSFCRYVISKYGNGPYNYLMRNGERGLFIIHNKTSLGLVGRSFIYDSNVKHVIDAYDEYFDFKVHTDLLEEHIKKQYTVNENYYKFIDKFYENMPYRVVPKYNLIKSNKFGRDWHFSRYLGVAQSYEPYKNLLDYKKACDNNYLLEKANIILEEDWILNELEYSNILIDEFQDTDHYQKDLFDKLLTKKNLNSFTVVGDADQSIYGWRGAYPDLFKKYVDNEEGYNFELITLHKNYRSSKAIVEFNEEFIKEKRTIPKKLISNKGYGNPVYYLPNTSAEEEAMNIVSIIRTLKEDKKIEHYGDIALLFRRKKDIENIIKTLENEGIPFYLKNKNDLYDQSEVKAILTMFWYIMPFRQYKFTPGNESFLNLKGFTDEEYKSSHIFDLTDKTKECLIKIQNKYDDALLEKGKVYIRKHRFMDRDKLYKEIFDLSDKKLHKIFENIETKNLSELDEFELLELGIDSKDLDFFMKLKNLKLRIDDKLLKNHEKLTTLDIFYELLNIIKFYDEIVIQNNKEAKRIKSNLALITEVIYDYESIVGKYEPEQLFNYLNMVLTGYSCPIHELEDNIDKVHIMTIHKSKGLEYPVVIIGSVPNKLTPSDKPKKFPTPVSCLEYKPDNKKLEDDLRVEEENRVLYVGMTRAEELLILSSVDRHERPPSFINDINKNFHRIRKLEPYNLSSISKMKSSKKKNKSVIFPELSFEEIINDYLFCPMYYDIYDNTKFKNRYNDSYFTEQRMFETLEKIFNESNQPDFDIDSIISGIKESYFINSGDDTSDVLNGIPEFWEKYGKFYTKLENVDMGIPGAYILNNCDLYGKIDLIIKEDDETISIVKFISSDAKIKSYINYYEFLLSFYGFIANDIKGLGRFKIKNIISHSIKENNVYTVPFNKNNEETIAKDLISIVDNIINENYEKYERCDLCPYNGIIICKNK